MQPAHRIALAITDPHAQHMELRAVRHGRHMQIMGALLFGTISSISGSQRVAMLSMGVLFLIGFFGMFLIDEDRGRRAAEAWVAGEPG